MKHSCTLSSSIENIIELREMFTFNLCISLLFVFIFVDSGSLLYLSPSFDVTRRVDHDSTVNNNKDVELNIVNKTNTGKRKSAIKCDEYVDDVMEKVWMMHPSDSKPFSISVPCKPPINLLISGGDHVQFGDFRHMAAIGWLNKNGTIEYLCGGSLISESWVITAAHCTQDLVRGRPSVIRLGSIDLYDRSGLIIKISDIIRHPEYKRPRLYSDIALIKLNKPVTFTDNIRPACLSSQPRGITKAVWATGWGQTSPEDNIGSDTLMKVRLDIVDDSKCASVYRGSSVMPEGFLSGMLCAGDSQYKRGRDTCRGDSGGPLQTSHSSWCLYEILGITSFGKVCALPDTPAVYTRISHYIDWVEEIVWP